MMLNTALHHTTLKFEYHVTTIYMIIRDERVKDVWAQTMIAPFGAGIALNPGEICNSAAELVGAVKKRPPQMRELAVELKVELVVSR